MNARWWFHKFLLAIVLVACVSSLGQGAYRDSAERTLAVDDATPPVQGGCCCLPYATANENPTTITTFDDGTAGQVLCLRIADANTTIDGGLTRTGMTIPCIVGDTLSWKHNGAAWLQIAGSVGMGRFVPVFDRNAIADWPTADVVVAAVVTGSDDGVRKGACGILFQWIGAGGTAANLHVRVNGSAETGDATIVGLTTTDGLKRVWCFTIKPDNDAKVQVWYSADWSADDTANAAWVAGYWI